MPLVIVMLSGKIATGKTYTALELFNVLNDMPGSYSARVMSCGLEAKKDFVQSYNLPSDTLTRRDTKERYRTSVIQHAMTERHAKPYVWVERMWNNQLSPHLPLVVSPFDAPNPGPALVFVCDDFRFINECEYVQRRLNIIGEDRTVLLKLRLRASDETRRKRGWVPNDLVDLHPSECDLDNYCGFDMEFDTDQCDVKLIGESVERVLNRYLDNDI